MRDSATIQVNPLESDRRNFRKMTRYLSLTAIAACLLLGADTTGLEKQRPAIAKQQEEEEWHDAKDYYNSGVASLDKLEYAKAISDFTEAITLDPNYALAYCNRGMAYEKQRNFDKAISDYDEAIRLAKRLKAGQ